MSAIPLPKPETLNAFLESYGYPNKRATLHVYSDTRECQVQGPRGEAYAFIFRCTETGIERVWGIVDRFVFSKDVGN